MMNKEPSTLEDMQPDHRQWDYERSAWRVDIERWRTASGGYEKG